MEYMCNFWNFGKWPSWFSKQSVKAHGPLVFYCSGGVGAIMSPYIYIYLTNRNMSLTFLYFLSLFQDTRTIHAVRVIETLHEDILYSEYEL